MGEELILELHLMGPNQIRFGLHPVAFDGMAKGPGKRTIFDLALDQIVLRAFFHGFGGQYLVVQAGQNDHGDAWRDGVRPSYGFETMPIRQSHIQKHDVRSPFRKVSLGIF
jgi:hypothetical protein